MSDCWRCEQKAAYKNERMNLLREEAKTKSAETGKTMAIIQLSGCDFKVVEKDEVKSQKVKEYISADNSS